MPRRVKVGDLWKSASRGTVLRLTHVYKGDAKGVVLTPPRDSLVGVGYTWSLSIYRDAGRIPGFELYKPVHSSAKEAVRNMLLGEQNGA